MYQSITVVGRLGRDPEMKYLPNGDPVTTFSIATDRKYKGRDGNTVAETTWFRVSVFGKQAETANEYLRKGRMALIEGRLKPDPKTGSPQTFTKQDGTVGTSFEIVANSVRFLSPKDEGGVPAPAGGDAHGDADTGEDIPF
jgi:single-strand DNA-binding protein